MEVSGDQKRHADDDEKKSRPDQYNSEKAPIIVKLATSPERDKEAADEAEYAKQEATNDWRLFIVTCVLALAAILQWGVLVFQSIVLNRQVRLSREEFNSSHRPKLIMRDVRLVSDETAPNGWAILYEVVNVGDAKGTIVGSVLFPEIIPLSNFTFNYRAGPTQNQIGQVTISSGASYDGKTTLNLTPNFLIGVTAANDGQMEGNAIHFAGSIEYLDGTGNRRRMVFRRKYVPSQGRFVGRSDPETDYSD